MESLPLEIAQNIFALACVDRGFIGCTLSLVSKRVQALSAATHFQSVAISGEAKVRAFLRALESRPPDLRRVRFLLIDWMEPPWYCAFLVPPAKADVDGLCSQILSLTAAHLRVLSVHRSKKWHFRLPAQLAFPCLTELAFEPVHLENEGDEHRVLVEPNVFPVLRRLLLSMSKQRRRKCWWPTLDDVIQAAPALHELGLSCLTRGSSELAYSIVEEDMEARCHSDAPLLGRVARLVLRPGSRSKPDPNQIEYTTSYFKKVENCEMAVHAALAEQPLQFCVLDPVSRTAEREVRWHWDQVVDGGDGCFAGTCPEVYKTA